MKNEQLKLATVLIIRRGAQYMVGKIPYSLEFRWSSSPYDAWKTRSEKNAKEVAHLLGGDLWLFNPPTGQLKHYAK